MTMPAPAAPTAASQALAGYGMSVSLPPQWEGRIYQRAVPSAPFAAPAGAGIATPGGGGDGWAGERPNPVLHLANFALPAGRGDYGTGAVERMRAGHIFVALLTFSAELAGTALFASVGLPRPGPSDFNPNALQRRLAGQAGYQRFCTVAGRPLCLYVVLGASSQAAALCAGIGSVLDAIDVRNP